MGEAREPSVYSIAAHRGFADALVAGLVPRYAEDDFGLARLTLLVPSSRAARTISEAFVRHSGETGLLMPRMVTVGDLDLDEALGSLLDPLGASDIPPAVEPTQRWLEIAKLIEIENAEAGKPPLTGAARLRLARDVARAMDRLLVEDVPPDDLWSDRILDMLGNLSGHWQDSLRLFRVCRCAGACGLTNWAEWTRLSGAICSSNGQRNAGAPNRLRIRSSRRG